jgi:hypothetical protein
MKCQTGCTCRRHKFGAANPAWRGEEGDERARYQRAHGRVSAARGKASQHVCVDCGVQAQDWSNRTGDIFNIDDFDPRCRKCHTSFDRTHRGKHQGRYVGSTCRDGCTCGLHRSHDEQPRKNGKFSS